MLWGPRASHFKGPLVSPGRRGSLRDIVGGNSIVVLTGLVTYPLQCHQLCCGYCRWSVPFPISLSCHILYSSLHTSFLSSYVSGEKLQISRIFSSLSLGPLAAFWTLLKKEQKTGSPLKFPNPPAILSVLPGLDSQ